MRAMWLLWLTTVWLLWTLQLVRSKSMMFTPGLADLISKVKIIVRERERERERERGGGLNFQLSAPAFIREGPEGRITRGSRRWRGGCSRCVGEMHLRVHHDPCTRDFISICAYRCATSLALPMDWVRWANPWADFTFPSRCISSGSTHYRKSKIQQS